MRLVRSIERLESRGGRRDRGRAFGLVWSEDEVLLEGGLARDEFLAIDVFVVAECEGLRMVRLVERATRDRADRGFVFGPDGARVGRVVDHDGSLVTVAWLVAGAEVAAPLAPPVS